MCAAGLLRVRSSDDLSSWFARTMSAIYVEAPVLSLRGKSTVVNGLLSMEPGSAVLSAFERELQHAGGGTESAESNSRSLLASETLEDDLGVGIDAQVIDCGGVGGGRGAVGPARELAQQHTSRPELSGDGLQHDLSRPELWRETGVRRLDRVAP